MQRLPSKDCQLQYCTLAGSNYFSVSPIEVQSNHESFLFFRNEDSVQTGLGVPGVVTMGWRHCWLLLPAAGDNAHADKKTKGNRLHLGITSLLPASDSASE